MLMALMNNGMSGAIPEPSRLNTTSTQENHSSIGMKAQLSSEHQNESLTKESMSRVPLWASLILIGFVLLFLVYAFRVASKSKGRENSILKTIILSFFIAIGSALVASLVAGHFDLEVEGHSENGKLKVVATLGFAAGILAFLVCFMSLRRPSKMKEKRGWIEFGTWTAKWFRDIFRRLPVPTTPGEESSAVTKKHQIISAQKENERTFLELHNQLAYDYADLYPNAYVAIHDGKVVDHDTVETSLQDRIVKSKDADLISVFKVTRKYVGKTQVGSATFAKLCPSPARNR